MDKTKTKPDGWAQMMIEGRLVTFDTTRFKPGADEQVVHLYLDGRIAVGTVRSDDGGFHLGPRCASEQWRATGRGSELVSHPVLVLGVVVE
jgi:hypothetical protein